MPVAPWRPFELPDTMAALPRLPFEFSPAGRDEAAAILASPPGRLFQRLLRDQESEAVLLAARHVLEAYLPAQPAQGGGGLPPAELTGDEPPGHLAGQIAAHVRAVRDDLAAAVTLLTGAEPEVREAVLRQRAPLALLGGCWLDVASQPATQPSIIVNQLFAQHVLLRGDGVPQRDVHRLRWRAMEEAGIQLPDITATDFLDKAGARPLTALHGCFHLALARLPANFLPEVVGVHYAWHALGVDDQLYRCAPVLPETALREVLTEYLGLAGPDERQRLCRAVGLVTGLEQEHVAMLRELASWHAGLPLEARVAEIIGRHGPMAGRQHGPVCVGGRFLADLFADPSLDLAAFLAAFRESPYVRRTPDGSSPFLRALRLGGPMFGIFGEREAATFRAWIESLQAGERPQIRIPQNTAGDTAAERWRAAIAASDPADVVVADTAPSNHRELFYRLVNIENFAGTLPLAAARAEECFAAAEILFERGAEGKYTDASWFDYSPEALYERAARVYWDKLVDPYRPLEEIPSRDEVLFIQSTYHLTYLIDGAWLHRLANAGHRGRDSDAGLFAIYVDEMGGGDLNKNHITLTHRALASMGLRLPHIRDAAFMDQDDIADDLYGFALQQLCMCMFPDRFYNEILGYNLAIEMFGAGEVRLHEMQKLRHYGFDVCYEQAHLTIDNFSAGHTRQAADIIVAYLDGIGRTAGEAAVAAEWRRIWRGYASFAWLVEKPLLNRISQEAAPGRPAPAADPIRDELLI
jgi:hypothetical protein